MKSGLNNILKIVKFIIFSLLPVIILFFVLESGLRWIKNDSGVDKQYTLDEEKQGLIMEDNQLFWKMKPNLNLIWQEVNIKTNSLGLRDNAVSPDKKESVFRILSLGESTTFGAKVEFERIYSEVLERRLNTLKSNHIFEVINAGVSAYTSFQSLVYLKKYGLKLKPDMLLLYYETNDNLPTSIRNMSNVIALTDRQIYKLRNYFGGLPYFLNKSKICEFMKKYITRLNILLLEKSAKAMAKDMPNFNRIEAGIKCRVPLEDRKQIFKEFLEISKKNNIILVIIHPTYKYTIEHQCFLTEFATQNNVPLVETYKSFQDSGYSKDELFYDNMHPTTLGHRLIADRIFRYIEPFIGTDRKKR